MNSQLKIGTEKLLQCALFLKLRNLISSLKEPLQELNESELNRIINLITHENLFTFDSIILSIYSDINTAIFIASLAIHNTDSPLAYEKVLELCQEAKSRGEIDTELFIQIFKSLDPHHTPESYITDLVIRIKDSNDFLAEIRNQSKLLIEQKQWLQAFDLLKSIEEILPVDFGKSNYSNLAFCAHMLGRHDEAEIFTWRGLGDSAKLITQSAVTRTEKQIIANWQSPAQDPLISIFCISYNHARYIDLAIQGFLIQETKYSFEIIIHDDASTDGTQALINEWQRKYPNLIRTILQEKNMFSQGKRALDLMLKQARGKYIAACEGDDYWLDPHKLEKQVSFLEENPSFSCCVHNHYLFEEGPLTVQRWISEDGDRTLSPRELKNLTRLLWLPTLVFRKVFDELPKEREFASLGDSFITSYLGVYGSCMYFQSYIGAVRRMNQFSFWTPMPELDKEKSRIKTRFALVRLHERLGDFQAAADLLLKISRSSLDSETKEKIWADSIDFAYKQSS